MPATNKLAPTAGANDVPALASKIANNGAVDDSNTGDDVTTNVAVDGSNDVTNNGIVDASNTCGNNTNNGGNNVSNSSTNNRQHLRQGTD